VLPQEGHLRSATFTIMAATNKPIAMQTNTIGIVGCVKKTALEMSNAIQKPAKTMQIRAYVLLSMVYPPLHTVIVSQPRRKNHGFTFAHARMRSRSRERWRGIIYNPVGQR